MVRILKSGLKHQELNVLDKNCKYLLVRTSCNPIIKKFGFRKQQYQTSANNSTPPRYSKKKLDNQVLFGVEY